MQLQRAMAAEAEAAREARAKVHTITQETNLYQVLKPFFNFIGYRSRG